MELKEFVKETLLQLTEGVREAQNDCKKHGGLVNPMLEVPRSYERKVEIRDKYYPAATVEFKVGLTENVGNGDKKGIGVFLNNLSIGVEQKKDTGYQSVTSIEFSIPVVLPFVGRDGEYIDLTGLFQ